MYEECIKSVLAGEFFWKGNVIPLDDETLSEMFYWFQIDSWPIKKRTGILAIIGYQGEM